MTAKNRSPWLVRCAMAIGLAIVSGCGASSTPQSTFAQWSSAVNSHNFQDMWACLTPQSRGTVLQILAFDSDLLSELNDQAKSSFQQVYEKHGLNTQDGGFPQKRLAVKDPADLAADLDVVFRQFTTELEKVPVSRYAKLSALWSASAQTSLDALTVEGTQATATIVGQLPNVPASATVEVKFEKVNQQWLLAELESDAPETTSSETPQVSPLTTAAPDTDQTPGTDAIASANSPKSEVALGFGGRMQLERAHHSKSSSGTVSNSEVTTQETPEIAQTEETAESSSDNKDSDTDSVAATTEPAESAPDPTPENPPPLVIGGFFSRSQENEQPVTPKAGTGPGKSNANPDDSATKRKKKKSDDNGDEEPVQTPNPQGSSDQEAQGELNEEENPDHSVEGQTSDEEKPKKKGSATPEQSSPPQTPENPPPLVIGGFFSRSQENEQPVTPKVGTGPGNSNANPDDSPNKKRKKKRADDDDEEEEPVQMPNPSGGSEPGLKGGLKEGGGLQLPVNGQASGDEDEKGRQGGFAQRESQYKQGTADYAIAEFLRKISAGDYEKMDEIVSSRAKGLLANIRDGKLDDDKKEELKTSVGSASLTNRMMKNKGGNLEAYLQGSEDHVIQFTLAKEEGDYKIREMRIRESARRR